MMQKWTTITPPYLAFARPRAKREKILAKLLNHFRRWHDCTERVQQAVKPLGYPRGGVLSPEGFQRIAPTKSKKKKSVSEKIYDPYFSRIFLDL